MFYWTISILLLIFIKGVFSINTRPVIGILSIPLEADGACVTLDSELSTEVETSSCFSAYYVNWLESSGARVAVIKYTSPPDVILEQLSQINGILFTGGNYDIQSESQYKSSAKLIFDHVQSINKNGQYFPLWGTCMGFQLLNILAASNPNVLSINAFNSENISYPLDLTSFAKSGNTKMLKNLSDDRPKLFTALQQKALTSNLHHDGVFYETFETNSNLTTFFDMISHNEDRDGNVFVSTVEAKDYPIYATQWHPERPQFEWKVGKGINHSGEAIEAMQYFSNFFVSESRRSSQTLENKSWLIYNYRRFYVGDANEVYIFD
eukprot:g3402.t1